MVLTEFSWTKSCHHRAKTATTCCWSFPPGSGGKHVQFKWNLRSPKKLFLNWYFLPRRILYRQGFYGVPPALRAIFGQREAAPMCSSRCSRGLPSSGLYVCDAWTIPLWASITTNRLTVTPLAAKITYHVWSAAIQAPKPISAVDSTSISTSSSYSSSDGNGGKNGPPGQINHTPAGQFEKSKYQGKSFRRCSKCSLIQADSGAPLR